MAIKKVFGLNRPETSDAALDLLRKYALSDEQLDALDIPEKDIILSPWLSECSYNMVSAARGLGKTWWLLDMAVHITHGTQFCGWDG